MSYYLYRRANGDPEVTEYELPLDIFPGFTFVSGPHDEKPALVDKELADDGTLQPSLAKLKEAKSRDIEDVRDRRLVAPVLVYDGKNLDGDAQAKSNLSDKLWEVTSNIARGKSMPVESLVWKDHDNEIHAFPDMASYKDWLDGYVIAFGERNTAVWAWSWQKKAQLEAITTVDELLTFNPST